MTEKMQFLIVDDDPMMSKTVPQILQYKGYKVETAHSGSEALEYVRR